MSLKARLEGKERRRADIPVQVSDPAQDLQRAAEARGLLAQARITPGFDAATLATLEQAVADADRAVGSHFVTVGFTALHPTELEDLVASHTTDAGDVDREAMRPALAAACADDAELKDPAWWAEQFASGTWTSGERDSLYHELLSQLHYAVPSGSIPKG